MLFFSSLQSSFFFCLFQGAVEILCTRTAAYSHTHLSTEVKNWVSSTAARSRQDSWASPAEKIRPLEKKLGRKPATPPNHLKKCSKTIFFKFLGQFLPIIVKIRPQLGNLELGCFLGRWLPRPQEILLGHFWVQRSWIRPSGTRGQGCDITCGWPSPSPRRHKIYFTLLTRTEYES